MFLRKILKSFIFCRSSEPVAVFKHHTDAITSVEWLPSDNSVFASSGSDNQITLWDLAVEKDNQEGQEEKTVDVPPQLLFIHMVGDGDDNGDGDDDDNDNGGGDDNGGDGPDDDDLCDDGDDVHVIMVLMIVLVMLVISYIFLTLQGQKDIKELHWHAQIPGVIVSTAEDGFNVLKTISV
jgi:ribosome assembly protein RRB1